MTCLCGHGESCGNCDGISTAKDKEIAELKNVLQQIVDSVDNAMSDCQSGRALMSFRWIGRLARRGLGEADD